MPENTPAIAVDFDGVIHAYTKGWRDGTIYDWPVRGCEEALQELRDRYALFVHTTRNPELVAAWMVRHLPFPVATEKYADNGLVGIVGYRGAGDTVHATVLPDYGMHAPVRFWTSRDHILITDRKLPAVAYIDDRALHFTSWADTLVEVHRREEAHAK